VLGNTPIAAGDLMLVEVLQGFRTDHGFATARELLMSLTVVNMLNTSIALRSAENFRTLRKKGVTVRKTIDTIIATYCIENNFPLLYSGRDFQPFRQHLTLQSAL
jgi:predicted nucleic acid-binding protein